jgi:hypothetical protein
VIRPLLRHVALRPRLATVLEADGIFMDPVGAIVAAVTLELAFVSAGAGGIGAGVADAAARLEFLALITFDLHPCTLPENRTLPTGSASSSGRRAGPERHVSSAASRARPHLA